MRISSGSVLLPVFFLWVACGDDTHPRDEGPDAALISDDAGDAGLGDDASTDLDADQNDAGDADADAGPSDADGGDANADGGPSDADGGASPFACPDQTRWLNANYGFGMAGDDFCPQTSSDTKIVPLSLTEVQIDQFSGTANGRSYTLSNWHGPDLRTLFEVGKTIEVQRNCDSGFDTTYVKSDRGAILVAYINAWTAGNDDLPGETLPVPDLKIGPKMRLKHQCGTVANLSMNYQLEIFPVPYPDSDAMLPARPMEANSTYEDEQESVYFGAARYSGGVCAHGTCQPASLRLRVDIAKKQP